MAYFCLKLNLDKRNKKSINCLVVAIDIEQVIYDFVRLKVRNSLNRNIIDSILRGWKIPPVHVIHNNQSIDEVLDGQQRLAAIRDFYDNIICIDRKILPENSELIQLDGMHYRDLFKKWQRQFRQYSIVIIRLTEYHQYGLKSVSVLYR